MSRLLKQAVPVVLAVLLLLYALKDVSYWEIRDQFRQSDYAYIVLCGLSILAFYICRGIRWRQPLLALGYKPTAFRATVALMTGTIASMIFPGVGELTRCATLLRTDGVPLSQGVGSVVAERMIDLLMLTVLIAVTMLFEFSRMTTYLNALSLPVISSINLWLLGLICISMAGLVILFVFRPLPIFIRTLYKKLLNMVDGLWSGFSSILNLPNPALFILVTLCIQVLSWTSTYLLLLSVSTDKAITPGMALMVLTVGSIGGLAVPTQAGIGTYHFLVSRALMLYGFSAVEGVVVATFMHAVGFAINIGLSGISFLIVPFLVTKRQAVV